MTGAAEAYARALTELSDEQGNGQELYEAVSLLQELILENPQYLSLLASPVIPKGERLALVAALLQGFPLLLRNTVSLMCEKNAAALLSEMLEAWLDQYRSRNGILSVTAISAVPLSEPLTSKLIEALRHSVGKEIHLRTVVDPACLGGLRLQMEGRLYDGSVQTRLEEVHKLLSKQDTDE